MNTREIAANRLRAAGKYSKNWFGQAIMEGLAQAVEHPRDEKRGDAFARALLGEGEPNVVILPDNFLTDEDADRFAAKYAEHAPDTVSGEPRHEVECPSCGATIRARMADASGAAPDELAKAEEPLDFIVVGRLRRLMRDRREAQEEVVRLRAERDEAYRRGYRDARDRILHSDNSDDDPVLADYDDDWDIDTIRFNAERGHTLRIAGKNMPLLRALFAERDEAVAVLRDLIQLPCLSVVDDRTSIYDLAALERARAVLAKAEEAGDSDD